MHASDDTTGEVEQGQTPAFSHAPVLLAEVLEGLSTLGDGVCIDCTLGGAGHTLALLAAHPSARIIGIDRDPAARAAATATIAARGQASRVTVVDGVMGDALEIARTHNVLPCRALLADIGVSSHQLDTPSRGMSFRMDGPLDMRMDTTRGLTCEELIAELDEQELANVIYRYGEERASRPIARRIKQFEAAGEMTSTRALARAVYKVLGPPRGRGIDPATRTFQALRIAVNDELGQLESMLRSLPDILEDDGRVAIITFHSLEDRLVKHALRDTPSLEPLHKKPIVASDREASENPRARSAKLRIARRIPRSEQTGSTERDVL